MAWSELPMTLSVRRARSGEHRLTDRHQLRPPVEQLRSTQTPTSAVSGNSARWTDSSRVPGSTRHSSSAVTGESAQGAGSDRQPICTSPFGPTAARATASRTCRAGPWRCRCRTRLKSTVVKRVHGLEDGRVVVAGRTPRRIRCASLPVASQARSDRPPASSATGIRSTAGSKSYRFATRFRHVLRIFRYASTTRVEDLWLPTRTSSRKSTIAAHRRRISAPLCAMTSCGSIGVAERFRHLPAVCSSTTMPCVRTARNGGGRPRVPRPTSSELWNQPRY